MLDFRQIEHDILANGRIAGPELEVLRRQLYAGGQIDRRGPTSSSSCTSGCNTSPSWTGSSPTWRPGTTPCPTASAASSSTDGPPCPGGLPAPGSRHAAYPPFYPSRPLAGSGRKTGPSPRPVLAGPLPPSKGWRGAGPAARRPPGSSRLGRVGGLCWAGSKRAIPSETAASISPWVFMTAPVARPIPGRPRAGSRSLVPMAHDGLGSGGRNHTSWGKRMHLLSPPEAVSY